MASSIPSRSALRPLPAANMASADFSLRLSASALQPPGEISPGKNALFHGTTAGSTPLRLDHERCAESCPLALLGSACYPVLVHRLAVSLHASSPPSVALMPLRFASFAVINLREDFHLQECAHAGRTQKTGPAPGCQCGRGRDHAAILAHSLAQASQEFMQSLHSWCLSACCLHAS